MCARCAAWRGAHGSTGCTDRCATRQNSRGVVRARRGVTLFEAVAAMTIIAMTSVAALAAAGAQFRAAEKAQRVIEAEVLASSRLEALTLLSEREIQSLPDSVSTGKFAEPLDRYSWKITSQPADETAGLYSVSIAILWTGGEYRVSSYVYRRPVMQMVNR